MKPLLVVNPRAGGGVTGRTFPAMLRTIESALGQVDVAMTEQPGHGIELARAGAKAGYSLIIAVGGDGTIHEVVNGIMQARGTDLPKPSAELGIIGQGTGGDLRRSLGLEHRLDRYLEAIKSGRTRALDLGKFTGGGARNHYFVNILSIGMGGLVDRNVATSSRAFGGKAAYFLAITRSLLEARLGRVHATVTHDDRTETLTMSSFMIAVCNGKYFGSGIKVAPMAELDDGSFDIVALGSKTKLGFALTQSTTYSGAHIGKPGTVHVRAHKVTFDLLDESARDVFLLDVDGEPMGTLPLTIELVPKALIFRG